MGTFPVAHAKAIQKNDPLDTLATIVANCEFALSLPRGEINELTADLDAALQNNTQFEEDLELALQQSSAGSIQIESLVQLAQFNIDDGLPSTTPSASPSLSPLDDDDEKGN